MIADGGFRPELRNDLLRRDLDGQAVVWSPIRRDPVALDAVSTVMLDVIDGVATVDDLVDDVRDAVGLPIEVARSRVERTIADLDEVGALATSSPTSVPERQRDLFINPPSS